MKDLVRTMFALLVLSLAMGCATTKDTKKVLATTKLELPTTSEVALVVCYGTKLTVLSSINLTTREGLSESVRSKTDEFVSILQQKMTNSGFVVSAKQSLNCKVDNLKEIVVQVGFTLQSQLSGDPLIIVETFIRSPVDGSSSDILKKVFNGLVFNRGSVQDAANQISAELISKIRSAQVPAKEFGREIVATVE